MKFIFLLLLIIVLAYSIYTPYIENYYSDYETISQLPFATSPHAPGLLGGWQQETLALMYPNTPVARFGCYNPPINANIYETGTAQNPNVYSEFGVVTPDDIWRF